MVDDVLHLPSSPLRSQGRRLLGNQLESYLLVTHLLRLPSRHRRTEARGSLHRGSIPCLLPSPLLHLRHPFGHPHLKPSPTPRLPSPPTTVPVPTPSRSIRSLPLPPSSNTSGLFHTSTCSSWLVTRVRRVGFCLCSPPCPASREVNDSPETAKGSKRDLRSRPFSSLRHEGRCLRRAARYPSSRVTPRTVQSLPPMGWTSTSATN
jgi:hypothetical protein